LYRRLRYRNCLNYITLHYITGGDHEDAPHHMAEHHTAGSKITQTHTA